ncbi:ABC-type sugar transport system, permease component [Rhizobium leguminosarum bv. trifolii WSM2297]|uniref:ABC-type sugar transport system, permease component n=1 Tax=Rhizobium leguminosarum bv. trifolii WSM2297 TaxID=754762 RepID=J0WCI9_RHILT|nr:carbohydrate ABC transporter permease [Rhizobium leguminosarum]EJC83531.1 ABC-type sugar transport system, permease component [Rhizobium leguminosarum bv. trifolii WSM2297]EJC84878.1 ABC-type sugar transport system, permease component [Rhizobium leguminosarum bv. trifolii WSM2297]
MTIDPTRHPHSVSADRHRLLRRLGTFASYAGLSLIALLFLFPFFWMVSNAVRSNAEVMAVPVRIFPEEYEWGTFVDAFVSLPFGTFLFNSLVVACGVTAIVIVVSCLSAYAFARLRFPGREGLLLTYLSTLMIPQVMLVIPLFLVVSKLGWINTYHGMILPVAFSSFGTFLLRQFILGIPKDLDEAAMMDGASRLRILVTVIVPLAMPAIGLLSLFTFIAQWKSFLWPLIATSGVEKATLPLGLTLFQTQQGTAWNYIMAGATISMVPGVILAIVLQRVMYKGISVGSGFGGR